MYKQVITLNVSVHSLKEDSVDGVLILLSKQFETEINELIFYI
jgi:hypothetical protein